MLQHLSNRVRLALALLASVVVLLIAGCDLQIGGTQPPLAAPGTEATQTTQTTATPEEPAGFPVAPTVAPPTTMPVAPTVPVAPPTAVQPNTGVVLGDGSVIRTNPNASPAPGQTEAPTVATLSCSAMHRLQLQAFNDRLTALANLNNREQFDPVSIKEALIEAGVTGDFELNTTVLVYESGYLVGFGITKANGVSLPTPMILGTPDNMSDDAVMLKDLGDGSRLYRGGTLLGTGGVVWLSDYSWPEFHSGECS